MAGFNKDAELFDLGYFALMGQDASGNPGTGSTLPNRSLIQTTVQPASGVTSAAAVYLEAGTVITRLTVRISTPAVSPTHWWLSVTNAAFTVLAETADQLTAPLSTTLTTVALPAPFVAPANGIYYYTISQVAATTAALTSAPTSAAPAFSILPVMLWNLTGQTGPAGVGTTLVPVQSALGQTPWILSS